MAIDTAQKRRNAANMHPCQGVSLLPDGTISAADRAQVCWTYGGIGIAAPPVSLKLDVAITQALVSGLSVSPSLVSGLSVGSALVSGVSVAEATRSTGD